MNPPGLIVAGMMHAVVLAAIHAASFAGGEHWPAEAFAAQLALPGVLARLAPAGGLVLARVAADEAEILTLAVAPPARRQGLGAALLRAAEAAAGAAGARRMILEVAANNEAGRALYAGCRYRAVGRRRQYYRDGGDALVLARTLSGDAAAAG